MGTEARAGWVGDSEASDLQGQRDCGRRGVGLEPQLSYQNGLVFSIHIGVHPSMYTAVCSMMFHKAQRRLQCTQLYLQELVRGGPLNHCYLNISDHYKNGYQVDRHHPSREEFRIHLNEQLGRSRDTDLVSAGWGYRLLERLFSRSL